MPRMMIVCFILAFILTGFDSAARSDGKHKSQQQNYRDDYSHRHRHHKKRHKHHHRQKLPDTTSISKAEVTIKKVWIFSKSKGWMLYSSNSKTVDLVTWAPSAVFGSSPQLPLGRYELFYVELSKEAHVIAKGKKYPLQVPFGNKKWLVFKGPIQIRKGRIESLALNFKVSKDIHRLGNLSYFLEPVLKIKSIREVSADTESPQIRIVSPDSQQTNVSQQKFRIEYEDPNIDRFSLKARMNGVEVTNQMTITDSAAEMNLSLFDGYHTLEASISDSAGNTAHASPFTLFVDTVGPALSILSPQPQKEYPVGSIGISGHSNEALSSLTVNGSAIQLSSGAKQFSGSVSASSPGPFELLFVATDSLGNKSSARIEVIINDPDLPSLPPDPATVAPPLNQTSLTPFHDSISFLYSGPQPIQTSLNSSYIQKYRASVVKGKILKDDGSPLPGVTISVLGRPDYGQTISRTDGEFDMVVNGGQSLTFDFVRSNHLPVQRKINIPWNDYVSIPEFIMLELDQKATVVDFSGSTTEFQVARGTEQTDSDGVRTATVLISPQTTAVLKLASGGTQAVSNLTVRLTEYTVGENGPLRMPAALPSTTSYTYAVELTADEALAVGARSVEFSQPVALYVENFIGFPVGGAVPVGFYDFKLGKWVASKNGRVVKVLSISNSKAVLDVKGLGSAATIEELNDLGINDGELAQIASIYQPGTSLWRITTTHFSPCDLNWPLNNTPPPLAQAPRPADNNGDVPNQCGSVINPVTQTLGERVKLTGMDSYLVYQSERTPGYREANTIRLNLTGDSYREVLKKIGIRIEVAGQVYEEFFNPEPNLTKEYTWNGLDAYGRRLKGSTKARVTSLYYNQQPYLTIPENIEYAFSSIWDPSQSNFVLDDRAERIHKVETETVLRNFDSKIMGFGGWSLSNHHYYDPLNGTVHLGTGGEQKMLGRLIDRVAGHGSGFAGDGGPAIDAEFGVLGGIDVGPDGSIYISDTNNGRIRKISMDGIITTIAGTGETRYDGEHEGGLAIESAIYYPTKLQVSNDGSIYFIELLASRIRKIDPNGIISTVVGSNGPYVDFENILATEATINYIYDLALDQDGRLFFAQRTGAHPIISYVDSQGYIRRYAGNAAGGGLAEDGTNALDVQILYPTAITFGPNGVLYYTETSEGIIRKIFPNGEVHKVAGNPNGIESSEGGLATNAILRRPSAVLVNDDGSFYVAEEVGNKVNFVDSEGTISIFAGSGQGGASRGDGGSALDAYLSLPIDLAKGKNGEIYIAQGGSQAQIRKVSANVVSGSIGDSEIPLASKDGSEVFVFNAKGQHLRTLYADLGTIKESFGYDMSGRLSSVIDSSGRASQIVRNGIGEVISIISPDGIETQVQSDANGYLSAIIQPDGSSYQFSYREGGLLSKFTKPNSSTSIFDYDELGRLSRDTNGVGGFKAFEKEYLDAYRFNMKVTTAEQRMTLISYDNSSQESLVQSQMDPSGNQFSVKRKSGVEREINHSNGVIEKEKYASDQRFKMQALMVSEKSTRLPSGLSQTWQKTRTVLLNDPNNVFDIVSVKDENVLNGSLFTSQFSGQNKEYVNTSPMGRKSGYRVNGHSKVTMSFMQNFEPLHFAYNSQNKISETVQGNRNYSFEYDDYGYLSSVMNPMNQVTYYENDIMGRVLSQTLADGREIRFGYDANGNLISVTPPGRPTHNFVLDLLGYIGEYIAPQTSGTSTTNYLYDLDNKLVKVKRPDGKEIDYNYSQITGLISTIQTPSGNHIFTHNNSGYVKTISSSDGINLGFQYDGFLKTHEVFSGIISGSALLGYNSDFRVSSQTVNGESIQFSYDSDGMVTGAGSLAIGRNSLNALPSFARLGSVFESYSYNNFGELSGLSSTNYSLDLSARDGLGRVIKKVETILNSKSEYAYTYDASGRLTGVHKDGVLQSVYSYDSNSNRVGANFSGVGITATYDNQDRLLSYGDQLYTYNLNGDLLTKTKGSEVTTYDYDVFGNLKQIDLPGGARIEYLVDGKNRRVGKEKNGVLERGYIYSDSQVVGELNGQQNLVSQFVYGTKPHVPDYMIKNGSNYKIVTDHLGSVRLVIGPDGSIAQRIDYDEFGRVLFDSNPGFQPFGFAGGLYDPDTKLVRFGARDYDPEIGRWTSKDPILFNGGDTNLYGYVLADPVNFIDPSGLSNSAPGPNANAGGNGPTGAIDINLTIGFGGGFNVGVQISRSTGLVYPYGGFGLTTPPGGVSVNYCPNEPSTGNSINISGGAGPGLSGGAQGGDFTGGAGLTTPGASMMFNHVFPGR